MTDLKTTHRPPLPRPAVGAQNTAVRTPTSATTRPPAQRDGFVAGTGDPALAAGAQAQVQASAEFSEQLEQIATQLEALPPPTDRGQLEQRRQVLQQLDSLVKQELRQSGGAPDLGGVVSFKAKSQTRTRGEQILAQLEGASPPVAALGDELRRLVNVELVRGQGSAPAAAPPQTRAPRAAARSLGAVPRDVSFDSADGALLLDGRRPTTWPETTRAFGELAGALDAGEGNPLHALPLRRRVQLLETARRAADGTLLSAEAGAAPDATQAAQLRRHAARVMNALVQSGLEESSPAGRELARDALDAARDLARAEPEGSSREAMVGDIFRHLPGLPDDLKEIPRTLMDEYVPVFAYESEIDGPSGLQPVARRHFASDENGALIGLTGPRVDVQLPEEIATKMDDYGLKPAELTPSPLPRAVEPSADGFVTSPGSVEAGASTAFYATTKVIDNADRWAGHPVGWGEGGKLPVKPYTFVTNFFNAYYDGKERELKLGALGALGDDKVEGFSGTPLGWSIPVEDMVLDGAQSRDIVAHEAGHAALGGVKPGLGYGMSMALNEAVADTTACLTAFDDPDVVARVLEETGGDLRRPSEATRIAETIGAAKHRHGDDDPSNDDHRFIRDMHSPLTLDDLELDRDGAMVPGMGISPSRDPHLVGEVISGGLYDLFASLYEQGVAAGKTPEQAIAEAKEVTGTLTFRATRHIGEHMITFRDYALALAQTDQEVYGGEHTETLRRVLEKRKLLDPGEDLDAAIAASRPRLPDFNLSPELTDPAQVKARVEELEAAQVARARASDDFEEKRAMRLLRHNAFIPDTPRIPAEDLELFSDDTSEDGMRVVRFRYQTEIGDGFSTPSTVNAYKSLVFDREGQLIELHVDAPQVGGW